MTDEIITQDEGSNNTENQEQPKWWIDADIPGIGDKPSWLSDKFKTVADMAKSNSELEKRLGSAPEKYDFSKSKHLDGEFASFHEFADFAKSKKVPQEVVDKFIDATDRYLSEFSTDPKEEFKKLGDNAKERLEKLNNWTKANLPQDAHEALTSSLRTAEGIQALEQLRNKMMSSQSTIPNGNEGGENHTQTLKEIQSEMNQNLNKYKTDEKYRSDIQRRLASASKGSNFVDKAW